MFLFLSQLFFFWHLLNNLILAKLAIQVGYLLPKTKKIIKINTTDVIVSSSQNSDMDKQIVSLGFDILIV
jgi:hypothetical protein